MTQCQIVEAIIRHLRILHYKPNIVFLDFFICQPLQKSEALHLEAFRFKVRFSYLNTSSYTTAELFADNQMSANETC